MYRDEDPSAEDAHHRVVRFLRVAKELRHHLLAQEIAASLRQNRAKSPLPLPPGVKPNENKGKFSSALALPPAHDEWVDKQTWLHLQLRRAFWQAGQWAPGFGNVLKKQQDPPLRN